MTTDENGYAKSAALVAGTYYVKEIKAPQGYVLSGPGLHPDHPCWPNNGNLCDRPGAVRGDYDL